MTPSTLTECHLIIVSPLCKRCLFQLNTKCYSRCQEPISSIGTSWCSQQKCLGLKSPLPIVTIELIKKKTQNAIADISH